MTSTDWVDFRRFPDSLGALAGDRRHVTPAQQTGTLFPRHGCDPV